MIGTYTETGGRAEVPAAPPPADLRREIVACIGLLPQAYRLTLWLELGGVTQGHIAERFNVRQAAISLRLRTIRRWIAVAAPIRADLRRSVPTVLPDPVDDALLQAVCWLHEPVTRLAGRTGWGSRWLGKRWERLRADLGLPAVVGSARWAVPAPRR